MNKNPFAAIFGIFNKLTLQQKLVIGGSVVLTVTLLGVLIFFLNEPNFAVLYTNMAQEDASRVLTELNTQKIPYQLEDNGRTIKVPKEKLYETRLNLAGKGIPSSGIVGYEIFDKSTMGMSEFMQKLNYQRALEGELARTIMGEDGVEGARVHIVFPQKSIFKSEEKQPTASVVLKLRNNVQLSKNNITAIINLIASSVEGLKPNKITLIDTKGRLLSQENDDDQLSTSSTKQYEIKQNIENYLAQKAQSMLDNVLGFGNSMVQVNADINFDQIEKTMELYDPDSQIAISEQNIKTENNGRNLGDSSAQVSQNSTVNYEINKTIQKVIEGSGNIKRLSVAVVVNEIPKEVTKDGKTETVFEPRSKEQLNKLEEIIKNAVGINLDRQDKFSLVNIPFEVRSFENVKPPEPSITDNLDRYTNLILMVTAIIASLFVLKSLMKKLKNEKIIIGTFNPNELAFDGGGSTNLVTPPSPSKDMQLQAPQRKKMYLPVGDIEDEISDEAVRKKNQQEKISNYVAKNPVEAAKLINAWLHEDEF